MTSTRRTGGYRGRLLIAIAACSAVFLVVFPASAQAAPSFDGQVGLAVQVVSVRTQGTTATVEAWQRGLTGWDRVAGPFEGFIGENGTAPMAMDGVPATPTGVFALESVFGTGPPPGGLLPYRRVGANDWWDGDPRSSTYNTHQVCAPGTCRFDEGESEQLAIPEYEYSVVMGVNSQRVPGGGGAFFMHVSNGVPTAGCVSLEKSALLTIIRWLGPGAVIAIS